MEDGSATVFVRAFAGIGSSLWIKSKNNRSKSRNRGHRGKKEGRASGVSAEFLQTEILIRKENTKENTKEKDEKKTKKKTMKKKKVKKKIEKKVKKPSNKK